MTGFGAAEGKVGDRTIRAEIRSVNHRWFNFTARLPGEFGALEGEAREAVRQGLERGHVTLNLRWIDDAGTVKEIDWSAAEATVTMLRSMRDRFALEGEIGVDLVLRYADVFGARREPADAAAPAWAPLAPIVAAAVSECLAARRREGAVLAAALRAHIDMVEQAAERIRTLAPARILRERDRVTNQVRALLDGRALDEARIAQEIAMLADRLDITEELVRLGAHVAAVREALDSSAPVGKQLGFLAQELGREVNTIGSKANDAVIAHEVVAMKGELEKFREQLENLE